MDSKIWLVAVLAIGCASCTSAKRYLERGEKLFQSGEYEEAALNFRSAIQKDPNSSQAYFDLALTEQRQNKAREAYEDMFRAAKLGPSNRDTQIAFADFCVSLYEADPHRPKVLYDQISKVLEQLNAKEPKSFDALRLKGYLAFIDRKLPEGIADLREANQMRPFDPHVVYPLMQALIADHQLEEAEKLGEEMIRTKKEYGPVYDLLYAAYMSEKRQEQAEGVFKMKAANNPKRPEYAIQLAAHYAQLQQPAPADAIIKSLVARSAEFPQIYMLAGDFYARAGNWDEASRLLKEGIVKYPNDKILYEKKLTNVLIAEDKIEDAIAMVRAVLRDQPNDKESLSVQALLELDTNKPEQVDKAVAGLQAITEQAPQDVFNRFNLGRAYLGRRDFDNARREFLQVLQQSPGLWPAHLLLAEIASQTGKPGEMLVQADAVLAAQRSNARARLLRAVALLVTGKSVEANTELNRLIADRPNYRDAQIQAGFFDVAEKKYSQAEEVFRKFYPSLETRLRAVQGLVQIRTAQGKYDEALHLLEAELKTATEPVPYRMMLARAAIQAGKNDLAIAQLQKIAKESPAHAYEALMLLGETYSRQDSIDWAITAYERARAAAPNQVQPNLLLASLQDRAGHKAEAIEDYRSALTLDPENPARLNDLAFYLADNGGNLDEALSLAQRAVKKINDDPDFSDTLGWIYLKKNMADDALRIFNALVNKYPKVAVFRYHLAAALAARGDRAAARAALSDALTKKPSKEDEARIRELLARLG